MTNVTKSGIDLQKLPVSELLRLNAGTIEELIRRGVIRTRDNPVGGYAETLFCDAFGWGMQGNSAAGVDAICPDGIRYQIKARRITPANGSRQLSEIRNLDKDPFDQLAAVLFNADFTVYRAILIPHALVLERARFTSHTNSFRFMLTDDVWEMPGVVDATARLAVAMQ